MYIYICVSATFQVWGCNIILVPGPVVVNPTVLPSEKGGGAFSKSGARTIGISCNN